MTPGPHLAVIGMVRCTIVGDDAGAKAICEAAIAEHGHAQVIGCTTALAAMVVEVHARRCRMPVSAFLDRYERSVLAQLARDEAGGT